MMARLLLCAMLVCLVSPSPTDAHDGPPFPIVSERVVGPYIVSVWTDPDATDDGSPGGQFWIVLRRRSDEGGPHARDSLPLGTSATIAIRPLDRPNGSGPPHTVRAEPVDGNLSRQFAALLMDHEGRFAVHVTIDGPLGRTAVDAEVEATYDLRPPPMMIFVYLLPFVLVGALWAKLLLRRRHRVRE
jgi:hypothetical protein